MKTQEKETVATALEKLNEIVRWFEEQKEADVEKGLEKVREGSVLLKALRERLKEVENEFQEIKGELEEKEE